MGEVNLFGVDQELTNLPNTDHQSEYQRIKKINRYRPSNDKKKRCKVCWKHIERYHNGKFYHKCKLLGFTNCEATDIRVNNVCDKFSSMEKDNNG